MKYFDFKFFIGIGFFLIDVILCFIMIYFGHLGLWQFVDEPLALIFLIVIIIFLSIGFIFMILAYKSRKF